MNNNFIEVEEFLNQPIDIQRVFIDWWEPEIGDLFIWIKNDDEYEHDLRKLECCNSFNIVKMTKDFKGINEGDRIPLLTEGQLRQFIEDKDGEKIQFEYYFKIGYSILLFDSEGNNKKTFDCLGDNLLQAYWKVACEIAKG